MKSTKNEKKNAAKLMKSIEVSASNETDKECTDM